MALISTSDLALSPVGSYSPTVASKALPSAQPGTITDQAASAIFSRQSKEDLETCIDYCNRRWPGDQSCLLACKESAAGRGSGISDSANFFAGAVGASQNLQSDITDLYNTVSVPDWAQNTGINPSGTIVSAPVVVQDPSTPSSSDNSSLWLWVGGIAAAGLVAWLVFER